MLVGCRKTAGNTFVLGSTWKPKQIERFAPNYKITGGYVIGCFNECSHSNLSCKRTVHWLVILPCSEILRHLVPTGRYCHCSSCPTLSPSPCLGLHHFTAFHSLVHGTEANSFLQCSGGQSQMGATNLPPKAMPGHGTMRCTGSSESRRHLPRGGDINN